MKYSYKINGLDCPTDEKSGIKELIEKIAHEVEPDFKLVDLNTKNNKELKYEIIKLVLGIVLAILGMFIFNGLIAKVMIILSYIILLSKVVIKAIKLLRKMAIDENLLVTISRVSSAHP